MNVTVDNTEVFAMLNTMAQRIGPDAKELLESIGKLVDTEIHMNLNGRILQRRSGRLYDAWSYMIDQHGDSFILTVGTLQDDVPYSEIQDKGGRTGINQSVTIPASEYYSRVPDEQALMIDHMVALFLEKMVK